MGALRKCVERGKGRECGEERGGGGGRSTGRPKFELTISIGEREKGRRGRRQVRGRELVSKGGSEGMAGLKSVSVKGLYFMIIARGRVMLTDVLPGRRRGGERGDDMTGRGE